MKFLRYFLIALGVTLLIGTITYFGGPTASFDPVSPNLPTLKLALGDLETYVALQEKEVGNIKEGNESRVIWADSIRQTAYALVYLHGFSASPMEGAPVHMEVAKRYGMNLYLPRLSAHGLEDEDAFLELTPSGLMNTAKEALVIGKMLGKKVILMSCSTGATLGIYLMAHHPDIYAHIMYSPNIEIYDPTAAFMTGPWGENIVRNVVGDFRVPEREENQPDSIRALVDQYWYDRYRVEGLIALQALLDMTMTEEVFSGVKQPYFLGYYYKNDTAQDMTVSVEAMKAFHASTRTPDAKKALVAFPDAGDHVIASPLTSKSYEEVREATFHYLENTLGLSPVQ
jgi:pimeloyl-ACP methyl ester carboxylesterase